MKLVAFILCTLSAAVAFALPPAVSRAAFADRATLPADVQGYVRYLWIPAPADDLEDVGAAIKFTVCSTSRLPNLDDQLPVAVRADLYRLDLRALGWDAAEFNAVAKRHPYSKAGYNPLVLHATWFLEQISDGTRGDAYYKLLYGPKPPATRGEFLAFWRVDPKRLLKESRELSIWIEGKSGVSVQKVRTMLGWPSETGQLWETRDVLELDRQRDPREFAGREAPYDGQEWIVSVPKVSVSHQLRGAAQAYWLTAKDDKRVEKAPVDLVEDHSRSIGLAEIRNPISCHSCHATGLNAPSVNEFRRLLDLGVRPYAYDAETLERVQRLLFPIQTLIDRQNEDFAAFVKACNGLDGSANVSVYLSTVQSYRKDVTRSQAAHEIGCEPETITLALAAATDAKINLGLVLPSLGSGGAIPRAAWEQHYAAVVSYVYAWEQRQ